MNSNQQEEKGRRVSFDEGERLMEVKEEGVFSIQLIPQDSQGQLPEGGAVGRERRSVSGASINNFIRKTYAILQQKRFETIVSWAEQGEGGELSPNSFKIHNVRAFEQVVLPQYFKHSNMSSFVRQLNMYNFHKVRGDRNQIEFEHEKFLRNRPDLLLEIKRKQVDSTCSIPSVALLPHDIMEVQRENAEIKQVQRQSDSPDKRESSVGRGSGQQQTGRLVQLMQANRWLKRQKQQKSGQLRQLATEGRANMGHKFNKIVLAMMASKMHQDINKGNEQSEVKLGGVSQMQKIIAHIMGSSPPRTFSQYMGESQVLFNRGKPCNGVMEE